MSRVFPLRLSPEIHQSLAARAKEEGVSLNTLIVCELAKASISEDRDDAVRKEENS